MPKSWQTLEENVRELASAVWQGPCLPAQVGGVDIDGVISAADDMKILIEVTERDKLPKVREDIQKLITARSAVFMNGGMLSRCYCVIDGAITNAMKGAAEPHKINVVSFIQFKRIFFDFERYRRAREDVAFGSAVNPLSGSRDTSSYVPVRYLSNDGGREFTVEDIGNLVSDGKRVIMLGEYGTGKSRCLRELFKYLSIRSVVNQLYPIAIDLRESWGVKRGTEMIRRHLEELGIEEVQNATLRAMRNNSLLVLFDGFDELGSQAWSNDSDKLRAIRAKSLEGVKDLIAKTTEGIFISGREHYFNNNDEMFQTLGLNSSNTVVMRCKNEFTEEETTHFFNRLQEEVLIPEWLPRRPLICTAIAELSQDELDNMLGVGQDEIQFWHHFIHVICERDARIHASFDANTIELILIHLARLTRLRPANVGPITLGDVQSAFESVVGQAPVEDAAVMLQRLPALGRVKAESNDRQFIDTYILDGLRAKDIALTQRADENTRRAVATLKFKNPIDDLGQRILSRFIDERRDDYIKLFQRCLALGNVVLACDIAAAFMRLSISSVDFQGAVINDGHFIRFDMRQTLPIGLNITNSVFGVLNLPSAPPPRTYITNCLAERVFGVTSANSLPAWIKNLNADYFDSVESVSRIKQIGLASAHEILVTIVRKTFFQKGAGRKEEALMRGLGSPGLHSSADKVLNLLLREDILDRFRGDEGWVYTPNRAHAGRMKKMLYELRVSSDPVWTAVGSI